MKEYKIIDEDDYDDFSELHRTLNRLGEEGWHIVSNMGRYNYVVVLERDKETCKECGK